MPRVETIAKLRLSSTASLVERPRGLQSLRLYRDGAVQAHRSPHHDLMWPKCSMWGLQDLLFVLLVWVRPWPTPPFCPFGGDMFIRSHFMLSVCNLFWFYSSLKLYISLLQASEETLRLESESCCNC